MSVGNRHVARRGGVGRGEATNVNQTCKSLSLDSLKTTFQISPIFSVAFITGTPLRAERVRGEENSMRYASNGESRDTGEQTLRRRDDLHARSTSPRKREMLTSAYVNGVTHLQTRAALDYALILISLCSPHFCPFYHLP
jgi:hypothetical protein